jgi:NitT/TauT family transport system substrate-binding protein
VAGFDALLLGDTQMIRTLLAAVAAALALSAGHTVAADKVNYQLGFLPQGSNANVYLAVSKGLFAAENLEVTIMTGRGGSDTITKVSTGVADIGEVPLDLFLSSNVETVIPAKSVMVEFTRPPDSLVTTTTSGIGSLKDVAGKKIGTPTFTSSNLLWPVILKQNGVDPESVKLIKTEPASLYGMLATGQVDGIIIWATGASQAVGPLTAVGKTIKVIPWANSGYEGYGQTLIASNKMIAERPEVLKRFLKVMKQSLQMVYDNPQQGADAIKSMVPQGDAAVYRAQIDAAQPYFFNEHTKRDGLGVFNPARVKSSWEFVAKGSNYSLNKMDPMSVINGKFIAP